MKHEFTFECIWSIIAESEDAARAELWEDLRHNSAVMFELRCVQRLDKEVI